jgi:hypothetical protein
VSELARLEMTPRGQQVLGRRGGCGGQSQGRSLAGRWAAARAFQASGNVDQYSGLDGRDEGRAPTGRVTVGAGDSSRSLSG